MSRTDDPYARMSYRRLIAWPERIRREAPLLLEVLSTGPNRRLLDLGCGPGEHARFLAEQGFEVTGVDRSPAQIAAATEKPVPPGLRFVVGDLTELERVVEGPFGGALTVGNTLPHLDGEAMRTFASGLRAVLAPGAPVLVQILGYDRILDQRIRALPVNVRPGDGEEIAFVRLMDPHPDGSVHFFPTTLRLRPGADPPVSVERSREVHLRGWRRRELEEAFADAGFATERALGSFDGAPFDPASSSDLVLVLRAR